MNYAAEWQKGRLNDKFNSKLAEVVCSQLTNQRIVVLVARRDIEPLEQLLWDYKDEVARRSFQSWALRELSIFSLYFWNILIISYSSLSLFIIRFTCLLVPK